MAVFVADIRVESFFLASKKTSEIHTKLSWTAQGHVTIRILVVEE
jgi:hypothetical protein